MAGKVRLPQPVESRRKAVRWPSHFWLLTTSQNQNLKRVELNLGSAISVALGLRFGTEGEVKGFDANTAGAIEAEISRSTKGTKTNSGLE